MPRDKKQETRYEETSQQETRNKPQETLNKKQDTRKNKQETVFKIITIDEGQEKG